MAFHGLLSYSDPSNSNGQQYCTPQLDCQVLASRKRPFGVDLDSQEFDDLQEIVWRDVDQMTIKDTTRGSQVVAEQLRRKRMKCLCTQLESLLPMTTPKVITTLLAAVGSNC